MPETTKVTVTYEVFKQPRTDRWFVIRKVTGEAEMVISAYRMKHHAERVVKELNRWAALEEL